MSVCGKNFNVANFLDTINMINVKLSKIVVHIVFYLLILLSVTLTVYHGHSNIKQF